MKKLLKVIKVVGVAYFIWNTMVHIWISMSRGVRYMRLHEDELKNMNSSQRVYATCSAMIDEASEEWKLALEEL